MKRIASIDIGSNAARLLINEVRTNYDGKTEFIKLNLLRIPLRLGFDVFSVGKIGDKRKKMFIKSMKAFKQIMEVYEVKTYRACATSAMREAKNGKEIIDLIEKETGIQIEIISGDQEATLIYENHISEDIDKKSAYLYIDVGGGSTEVMFYDNEEILYKNSFNIGTIRLLTNIINEDDWLFMKTELKNNIKSKKTIVAIGSGGNINKVFSLSKLKDGKPMNINILRDFHRELSLLSIPERMVKYKLKEDRADVIVPALEIFIKVMSWSNIEEIYVPKISVADGIIHDIYENSF